MATGSDAVEVLAYAPRLRVENEQISMIGKSQMRVMINDKDLNLDGDALITYLRSIPSDNIDKIEIITTPPAKYDAQGNSGIINIVLKKSKQEQWNATVRSSYLQTTYSGYGIGGGYAMQKGKYTLSADINQAGGANKVVSSYNLTYPEQIWNGSLIRKDPYSHFSRRLNLDYELHNKLRFGIQYLGSTANSKNIFDSEYKIFSMLNLLDSTIVSFGENNSESENNSINFNVVLNIDSLGQKITADIDFFDFYSNKINRVTALNYSSNNRLTGSSFNQDNDSEQGIRNFAARIDYAFSVKKFNLNVGGKISNNQVISNIVVSNESLLQSDKYTYDERIQALYFSIEKEFNSKLSGKIGIRREWTQTIGFSEKEQLTTKNNYNQFFPTAYITYKPTENHFLNLSYSKRLDRPAFWELNPFRWYFAGNSFSEGNPFLQPSFFHNLELNYGYNSNYNIWIFFNHIDNGFSQVLIPESNFQRYTRLNYYTWNQVGLSQEVQFKIGNLYSGKLGMAYYYNKSNVNIEIVEALNGSGGSLSNNNNFSLNEDNTLRFSFNINYIFPQKSVIHSTSDYLIVRGGFYWQLLDKKLNINITANDIFRTHKMYYGYTSNGVKTSNLDYYDYRNFRLSLTYAFRNKFFNTQNREGANAEERGRL